MESAVFLLIMIGVGWLVIWSCVDHSKPSQIWWPFDLRSMDEGVQEKGPHKPGSCHARMVRHDVGCHTKITATVE
jgi:hypothetical protein